MVAEEEAEGRQEASKEEVLSFRHPVNRRFHGAGAGLGGRISDLITAFGGSYAAVGIHFLWWGFWFWLKPFEGPPWQNLTMVLSLEAILLGIFILMSQTRQGSKDRATLEHDAAQTDRVVELLEQVLQRLADPQPKE